MKIIFFPLLACTKNIPIKEFLVAYNMWGFTSTLAKPGYHCYFQGFKSPNLTTSININCLESFNSPYQKSEKSSFACKKYAPCNKLDCTPIPNKPEKCYR